MENTMDTLVKFATTSGLRVIGAILIFIAGRIFAGMARRLVHKTLTRTETDPTLISFLCTLTYAAILVFTVLAILAKFGIQTASFVAVLGAAGFAVGFALQGSLGNFAAGIMLLIFRPFKTGDFIEAAGTAGTVKDVQLFNTVLATPDNVKIIIPNGKLYGDIIKNYSAFDIRRVDLVIGIGYGSSIQAAFDAVTGLIKADSRILKDPEHQIAVTELADSSVNLVIRTWVNKVDYWNVKFDLQRSIKETFDEKGIEIPFPQRVVHMVSS
ncbi:MAG: mechanosensitive ion channel [Candidatus Eisenbacteria bacterium]|uniref:Mechanosensitive ion channel n=1 Tax=Eiseniibacteriota bacterium TaxID=2212470 RepID=A0A948RZP1_UNCEI|nr:mechanosensitive ion channel [Candidatus Eisenbacteria bacterium]MBU1949518.1 mechanosensitive ion channel [Candidatus Eisenbacteria bacterium]MBU2692549.1 mechanosensitive ion channel [Candidatus Eisenbacteria bacterium]